MCSYLSLRLPCFKCLQIFLFICSLILIFFFKFIQKIENTKRKFPSKDVLFSNSDLKNCSYIHFLQYSSCFASKLKRFARAGFYRVRSAACHSQSAKAAERQIRSKGESSPSKNWKELHVLFFAESGRRCHPTCQMLPGGKSAQKENLWNYFPVKLFKVKALKYHWIYPWE